MTNPKGQALRWNSEEIARAAIIGDADVKAAARDWKRRVPERFRGIVSAKAKK